MSAGKSALVTILVASVVVVASAVIVNVQEKRTAKKNAKLAAPIPPRQFNSPTIPLSISQDPSLRGLPPS